MTFGLKVSDSLLHSLKRGVQRQVDAATKALSRSAEVGDLAHTGRRTLKRARALLRLARPALSTDHFRLGNQGLRDAGRCMAAVRDADVLVETLGAVSRTKQRDDLALAWATLVDPLVARREAVFADAMALAGPFAPALDALKSLEIDWPAPADVDERELLRSGLAASLQAFLTCSHQAFREGADEKAYHTLRKRTKDLRHQVEFLRPIAPDALATRAKRLHRLGDALGHANDLALLASYVDSVEGLGEALSEALSENQRAEIVADLSARRLLLWAEAKKLSGDVFAGDAEGFVAQVDEYWVRSRPQG